MNEILLINERIKQVRERIGLKQVDFCRKVGMPQSSLSEIEAGKKKTSIEMIIAIAKCFPEINERWLLLGEGDMFKTVAGVDTELTALIQRLLDKGITANILKALDSLPSEKLSIALYLLESEHERLLLTARVDELLKGNSDVEEH